MQKKVFKLLVLLSFVDSLFSGFSFKTNNLFPNKIQSTDYSMLGKYGPAYPRFPIEQSYELNNRQIESFFDSDRVFILAINKLLGKDFRQELGAGRIILKPYLVLSQKIQAEGPYNIINHALVYYEFAQQVAFQERYLLSNFSIEVDFGAFQNSSVGFNAIGFPGDRFIKAEVNIHDIHYSPNNLKFSFSEGRDYVFFISALYLDNYDNVELKGREKTDKRNFHINPPILFLTFNLVKISSVPNEYFEDQKFALKSFIESLQSLYAVSVGLDKMAIQNCLDLVEARRVDPVVLPAMPFPVLPPIIRPAVQPPASSELEARIRACLQG